jgi:hypothetical protein
MLYKLLFLEQEWLRRLDFTIIECNSVLSLLRKKHRYSEVPPVFWGMRLESGLYALPSWIYTGSTDDWYNVQKTQCFRLTNSCRQVIFHYIRITINSKIWSFHNSETVIFRFMIMYHNTFRKYYFLHFQRVSVEIIFLLQNGRKQVPATTRRHGVKYEYSVRCL